MGIYRAVEGESLSEFVLGVGSPPVNEETIGRKKPNLSFHGEMLGLCHAVGRRGSVACERLVDRLPPHDCASSRMLVEYLHERLGDAEAVDERQKRCNGSPVARSSDAREELFNDGLRLVEITTVRECRGKGGERGSERHLVAP
jgi:hypothetical protein